MEQVINEIGISKLTKDLRKAATTLGRDEARFLVDAFYMMQRDRIRAMNQVRSLLKDNEPHAVLSWFGEQADLFERSIAKALDTWTMAQRVGRWARSQCGVGPIIAAGLLAHIDPEKAATAGAVWRFAGLDPTAVWNKGEKRPHNAALKVLCWKLGESLVKVSNNPKSFYGKLYRRRKEQEVAKNERKAFADQAAEVLKKKKIRDKDTKACYESGKLPKGHVDMRARRYAVKLFLSHYWHVSREDAGLPIVKPWPFVYEENHVHYYAPPGWPCD